MPSGRRQRAFSITNSSFQAAGTGGGLDLHLGDGGHGGAASACALGALPGPGRGQRVVAAAPRGRTPAACRGSRCPGGRAPGACRGRGIAGDRPCCARWRARPAASETPCCHRRCCRASRTGSRCMVCPRMNASIRLRRRQWAASTFSTDGAGTRRVQPRRCSTTSSGSPRTPGSSTRRPGALLTWRFPSPAACCWRACCSVCGGAGYRYIYCRPPWRRPNRPLNALWKWFVEHESRQGSVSKCVHLQ